VSQPDVVPAQLPPAMTGFTGRSGELASLARLVRDVPAHDAVSVAIATISGPAGSGKTTLAVHFAYQVADRFPDGQLYIDLRGFAAAPAMPAHVALGMLLEGLSIPQVNMPSGTEQRSSLYRSMLAGRRMLVVLDNALSPAQVNPLLPGAPGCLVLVTSRKRMSGLVAQYGARAITLDVLSLPDAVAVLAAVVEDGRIQQEPQAAERLATLCGFLPLALRVAAANLCADPGQQVADMVDALTAGNRLHRLKVDEGPAVSAALELSYHRLGKPTREVFRLLGLVPGPHFTAEAAAALAGLSPGHAARHLDHLLAMHLIQRNGPGQFNFHDLVRIFAAQQASRADSDTERQAALERLAGSYIDLADRATRHLDRRQIRLPGSRPYNPAGLISPPDETGLMTLLDDERPNLVALARLSGDQPGLHQVCWELADALQVYFQVRRHVTDAFAVAEAGLSAAVTARNRIAEAAMRSSLAASFRSQGLFPRAADEYARALAACRDSGWSWGEAEVTSSLAAVRVEIDSPDQSIANYEAALRLWRQTGDSVGEARTLADLGGSLLWKLGRLDDAHDALTRAVAISEQFGSPYQVGYCLINLGNVLHELGHVEEARTVLTRALRIHRETGARAMEAVALCDLGGVHRDLNLFPEALDFGQRALELSREIGDGRIEAECRNALSDCHLRMGAAVAAKECAAHALRITREIGYRYGQARAEIRLAAAWQLHGDTQQAARQAESAITLTRRNGYRMLEGNALTVLAQAVLARGDAVRAAELAGQAVRLLRETSHRPGQDAALLVLHQASAAAGADAAPQMTSPDRPERPERENVSR